MGVSTLEDEDDVADTGVTTLVTALRSLSITKFSSE